MRKWKRFADTLPILFAWLLLSALLWSWIFTFLTETTPEKKIVLFADVNACDSYGLSVALEEALPEGLQMVQARPFSYAMLNSDQLREADLFIIPAGDLGEYQSWLAPLPEAFHSLGECWLRDGEPVGLRVCARDGEGGAAAAYLSYTTPEGVLDDGYLCFGAQSLHVAGNPDAVDNAAETVAMKLLTLK